ncbi:MAG: hypothetical protein GC190_20085 [Alphaproteobacteria bacterium]|nr:hypothetical protein [Alphaproteobacteria bacterium]
MPISRKPSVPSSCEAAKPAPYRYPSRVVLFVIVRDESGSMAPYRQTQGDFIPAVTRWLIEAGGPKVADLIFLLYVVVSGGVVKTEFAPLSKAADPEYRPDGETPIGMALKATADACREFLETQLFPNEVTVRNFEVVIFSDLKATGETLEKTNEGVNAFIEFAKSYNAKVNLVGPNEEAMDRDLAMRLDIDERGVKYLDSDPKAVLNITFESLIAVSRAVQGGSNPLFRNL